MNKIPPMAFHYAIRNEQGLYYLGPSYKTTDGAGKVIPVKKQPRVDDPRDFGPKHRAYTYTYERACVVILQNKQVFAGCMVEKVL